jgi:hypothetical protein
MYIFMIILRNSKIVKTCENNLKYFKESGQFFENSFSQSKHKGDFKNTQSDKFS